MMMPKPINLIFIILLSSTLTNGIRRKSKIDLPIINAADAPLTDNIAIASSNDAQPFLKGNEQLVAATKKPDSASSSSAAAISSSSSAVPLASSSPTTTTPTTPASPQSPLGDNNVVNNAENDVDCDPDMIGFEIITG